MEILNFVFAKCTQILNVKKQYMPLEEWPNKRELRLSPPVWANRDYWLKRELNLRIWHRTRWRKSIVSKLIPILSDTKIEDRVDGFIDLKIFNGFVNKSQGPGQTGQRKAETKVVSLLSLIEWEELDMGLKAQPGMHTPREGVRKDVYNVLDSLALPLVCSQLCQPRGLGGRLCTSVLLPGIVGEGGGSPPIGWVKA